MSVLIIIRKSIPSTTSDLILANKKLFSKIFSIPSLFNMEKVEIIIL